MGSAQNGAPGNENAGSETQQSPVRLTVPVTSRSPVAASTPRSLLNVAASSRFMSWAVGATTRAGLRLDLVLTLFFTLFWLWFAWQHGYNNSPDSWYRGVLGKSIAEGHPYWINLKQGWAYEFSPWHHDAAHSPLLPAIYALCFLVFGPAISVTNVVVSAAAGLTVFPLLRLSRSVTGGMLAGLIVYLWVVFSASNDFLFEVFSGLSIPAAILVLAVALQTFWTVVRRHERRYVVLGAVAMAAYFYVRPGEQLLFFGFLGASLVVGFFMLPRTALLRVGQMWLLASLLVSPWLIRSVVLFGSPFFTHMTPLMWTDRGYDYWSYHESMPLPTPASYFATHSLGDLGEKTLGSMLNAVSILSQALNGQLAAYVAVLVLAGAAVLGVRSRRKRYFLVMAGILLLGYALLHGVVPVIDVRYMVMPIFCGLLALVFCIAISRNRYPAMRWLALAGAVLLFGQSQWQFWAGTLPQKIVFNYANSDQGLNKDPTIQALRQRFGPNDVFLGAIGDVQRLNFATGITFVEAPDNLAGLRNPLAFFQRYQIRYSLIDVTRILPDSQIEAVELVGDRPVYTIRLTNAAVSAAELLPPRATANMDAVFVDTFHGGAIGNESAFAAAGLRVVSRAGDLMVNREALLQAGLLVVRYEIGRTEFDEQELALIDQFVERGGRVLLLFPAWVAAGYEKKSLDTLGFNRIAAKFGILIGGEHIGPPFSIGRGFGDEGATASFVGSSVFSLLAGRASAKTILAAANGQPAAAAAELPNGARIVVWGHNNLFDDFMLEHPDGARMAQRILEWLTKDE